jgi:hypothetical protein
MKAITRTRLSAPRIAFYGFLITSPLNLYGIGSGVFNYRFSRLFLVLTLVLMAFHSGINDRFILRKLQLYDVLVLLYAALAVMSGIYVTNYPAFFVRLFGLVECILILYVVRMQTTNLADFTTAIRVYVLSAIFVVFAAGYQLYGLWNSFDTALPFQSFLLFEKYEEILAAVGYFGGVTANFMRISSTFGEPNMMGGYCASILPFVVVLVLLELSVRRRLRAFAYSVLGFAVVLTLISAVSKAAVLCAVVSILTLAYLASPGLSRRQKRATVILSAGMFLALGGYVLAAKDLFTLRLELGYIGHIEHRAEALREFVERPLLGFGFGNYEFITTHTLPLTAMLELGILGGIVVALISVLPLFAVRRLKAAFSSKADRAFLLLFAASYASYCSILIGLYLYDYWIHPFTWISISMLMSMVSQLHSARAAAAGSSRAKNNRKWTYQPNTAS